MFDVGDRVELVERYCKREKGDTGIIIKTIPTRRLITIMMDEKLSDKNSDKICCFDSKVKTY